MKPIVTRLVEVVASQKPATAAGCEELLTAQLNPGDQDQLLIELERTLAGRDQLRLYLRELEGRVARPSPWSDAFDDEVVARVSQDGLNVLAPGQLARLAVSPMLLLDLWDAIDDEGLSPYWLGVVRASMQAEERQRPAKILSITEMVATAKKAAGRPEPVPPGPSAWPGPTSSDPSPQFEVGAYLMQAAGPGPGHEHGSSPPPLPKRWEKEFSLSQAEWLSRDNPAVVASLEGQSVGLEFSWLEGERPRLEARFIRGPLAPPGGNYAATLVDRQGQELAASRMENDSLVFDELPPGGLDALAGARFSCACSTPGVFQLKIVVPVAPDGAEDG